MASEWAKENEKNNERNNRKKRSKKKQTHVNIVHIICSYLFNKTRHWIKRNTSRYNTYLLTLFGNQKQTDSAFFSLFFIFVLQTYTSTCYNDTLLYFLIHIWINIDSFSMRLVFLVFFFSDLCSVFFHYINFFPFFFSAVHPLIQVPNMLVGAPLGVDILIVCNAEASPKAINYWQRENGKSKIKSINLFWRIVLVVSCFLFFAFQFLFYVIFLFNFWLNWLSIQWLFRFVTCICYVYFDLIFSLFK